MSVVTLWEIGYLVKKKRVTLNSGIESFWSTSVERLNAQIVDINEQVVLKFHALPQSFHDDPGDRFLVSQALAAHLLLMTDDTKILRSNDPSVSRAIYHLPIR